MPSKATATALIVLWVGVLSLPLLCFGQQKIQVETLAEGLNSPCAIAIEPDTGAIFVSDSGNGRVVRIVEGTANDVVTGFPVSSYGRKPSYPIGPLGVAFLSSGQLLVGDGGLKSGEDLLRRFTTDGNAPIDAAAMQQSFSLPGELETQSEGNFYCLAVFDDAVYGTSNGDDTNGWIVKADRQEDELSNFRRFATTQNPTGIHAPVSIVRTPADTLLISLMGETSIRSDSVLIELSTKGELLSYYQTGLNDIVGIAIAPDQKSIFVVDFSWLDFETAGLYRIDKLDAEKHRCRVRKVTSLDRPTSAIFSDNGDLIVTLMGSPVRIRRVGTTKGIGKVVRITGLGQ